MKTTTVLATFAATALAVPALDAQCPKNDAQPDGKLTKDPNNTIEPSLLLQISAKEPNKKFSASLEAEVSPGDKCTIFNLDIPVKQAQNKMCNLVFDLPEKPSSSSVKSSLSQKFVLGQPLQHGHGHVHGNVHGNVHAKHYHSRGAAAAAAAALNDYVYDGPGNFTFTGYAIGVGGVAGETTYAQQPASGPNPPNPPPQLLPGHSYVINSAPCDFPANLTSVKVSGSLCSADTHLRFDQGTLGSCPIGFYVLLTDKE